MRGLTETVVFSLTLGVRVIHKTKSQIFNPTDINVVN